MWSVIARHRLRASQTTHMTGDFVNEVAAPYSLLAQISAGPGLLQ
jgi:hypothetical protein